MGSNRKLIVSATGFPGTNQTWRFIQDAWREPLKALALFAGDKVIVSGGELVGVTVNDGFIAYQGVIYPLVGGTLPTNGSVTLIKETQDVVYDVDLDLDGQQDTLPAYENCYFQIGTGGTVTFPFSDLTRLKTAKELSLFSLPNGVVVDPNYIALTQAMIDQWNGFVSNVQADWSVANSTSPAFIRNKPNFIKPLRIGTAILGDFPNATDEKRTISFPNVGTANYMVVGSLVSRGGNWNFSNDVIWSIGVKTSSSFELLAREVSPDTQNLKFEYMLIPIPTTFSI